MEQRRSAENEVHVERSQAGDGAAVGRLISDSYALYVARIGKKPAPMLVDYEPLAAAGKLVLAWGSESAGAGTSGSADQPDRRLLGMLYTEPRADSLFLDTVAVAPEAQGTGLGRRLMLEAEAIARAAGKTRIELYTNVAMAENLSYYPRQGYREIDRRTDEGYERVFFAKDLDPESLN